MPIYIYEATNKENETVNGELAASSQEEAMALLTKKKLTPNKIELKEDAKFSLDFSFGFLERLTALDRIILIRNLAATIKAGLSILEALEILIADATKKIVKKILVETRINVQNGQPLSQTFEQYHKYFPSIFVGLVKAGERSGQLDKTLDELSRHMSKEYNLVKKVKSALAYPVILLAASVGIVVLLLTFVLPRLTRTFNQSQVELPLLTRLLIKISQVLTYSLWLDLAVVGGLIGFFVYFRRTEAGKRFFSRAALFTPLARNLVKKVILVRFTRTLGSLIASALPIVEALELSAKVVGNHLYKKAILGAAEEIRSGIALSEALRKHEQLFPRFLTSLIAVGERTGTLENVLKTFADFYEEEVDGALKDLTTILEPLLLLFMGLVVGVIALAILLPIYQLVGKFV